MEGMGGTQEEPAVDKLRAGQSSGAPAPWPGGLSLLVCPWALVQDRGSGAQGPGT